LAAGAVAAYALSLIDLIPDFIPVLGHLDDALIVPVGIFLVVKLIPAPLMAEYRALASTRASRPARFGDPLSDTSSAMSALSVRKKIIGGRPSASTESRTKAVRRSRRH
jgi:uncharacterized membrane protein YkvA (DUF1232 family)